MPFDAPHVRIGDTVLYFNHPSSSEKPAIGLVRRLFEDDLRDPETNRLTGVRLRCLELYIPEQHMIVEASYHRHDPEINSGTERSEALIKDGGCWELTEATAILNGVDFHDQAQEIADLKASVEALTKLTDVLSDAVEACRRMQVGGDSNPSRKGPGSRALAKSE